MIGDVVEVSQVAVVVNVEGLTYIGTHGLEWCDGLPTTHTVQLLPEALPYVEPGKALLDLAEHRQPPTFRYAHRYCVHPAGLTQPAWG